MLIDRPTIPQSIIEQAKNVRISWGSDVVNLGNGFWRTLVGIEDMNIYPVKGLSIQVSHKDITGTRGMIPGGISPTVKFDEDKKRWVMIPSEKTGKFLAVYSTWMSKTPRVNRLQEVAKLKDLLQECAKTGCYDNKFYCSGVFYQAMMQDSITIKGMVVVLS